ncbi:Gfo/Idh/MocA family oxidoreductase [Solwaraspora sp. WMMD406]|uniref:Gfo/Idh/MocA family protein n=1 Tax=Solwaraspora sp. WMMD406 TaxID=3016095 RepID=UPI00241790BE|nr:Gfo/Idh/MocA family oxidoreductase [Solwaraspora sp. WMMD406]MDG4765254.1 Gfo/Idh/MocA family oxidoreductase [Solwaraspora sp. WMMD406]
MPAGTTPDGQSPAEQPTGGTLPAGVIGCGDAGGAHALTVTRTSRATLTATYDLDGARAVAVAARHGGTAVGSVEELVATGVTLVAIATGPIAQPQVVRRLIDAGYAGSVLCEKPLATSVASARRTVDAARDAGLVLAVNHERRFGLPAVTARRLVTEGAIGRLLRVEGYSPDGTLYDWAPHWIDLAFDVAGGSAVRWVHGLLDLTGRREHAGLLLERHGLLLWEHANGVRGQLECGRPVPGQPLLRLLGDDGTIEVGAVLAGPDGEVRGPALRIRDSAGIGWRHIDVGESALAAVQWTRSWDELIDATLHGRQPEHHGQRAVRALEVCLAGYLAARRGAPQWLPVDPGTDLRDLLPAPPPAVAGPKADPHAADGPRADPHAAGTGADATAGALS